MLIILYSGSLLNCLGPKYWKLFQNISFFTFGDLVTMCLQTYFIWTDCLVSVNLQNRYLRYKTYHDYIFTIITVRVICTSSKLSTCKKVIYSYKSVGKAKKGNCMTSEVTPVNNSTIVITCAVTSTELCRGVPRLIAQHCVVQYYLLPTYSVSICFLFDYYIHTATY